MLSKKILTPLYAIVTIVLLLNSCKKDDLLPADPVQELSDIETIGSSAHTDGGVTLTGKINKLPEGLIKYGFIISADSLFNLITVSAISPKPAGIGEFEVDVNKGLEKDKAYFYAAFSTTKSGVTLYNTRKFISNGSKTLRVDSIAPLYAHIGDTLTVHGKAFKEENFSLYFEKSISVVLPLNDSIFKCIVPPGLTTANPLISISGSAKTDTLTRNFKLYKPVIHTITNFATFGDTISLSGDHFDNTIKNNEVYFGKIKANVVFASRKQIKVIVPDDIEASNVPVTIKAQAQIAESPVNFRLYKPEITSVPLSGYVYQDIAIKGNYFHPNKNKVFINGEEAIIISTNRKEIIARISDIP